MTVGLAAARAEPSNTNPISDQLDLWVFPSSTVQNNKHTFLPVCAGVFGGYEKVQQKHDEGGPTKA